MKNSKIAGILLIAIGATILLHSLNVHFLYGRFILSAGFILLALVLLNRPIAKTDRSRLFWGAFFLLFGLYFLLGSMYVYSLSRGLTISVIIIIIGLACLAQLLKPEKSVISASYGSLFLLIGIFFLLEHLMWLPPNLLIYGVDRYWPVLLVLSGLFIIANNYFEKSNRFRGRID